MTDPLNKILNDAMQLSIEERVMLANVLYESAEQIDPDVEAAWSNEIAGRLRQIDQGEVELLDGETVMKEMQDIIDGRAR